MTITTTPCDLGNHSQCQGRGLVQGLHTPPHEPDAEGEMIWVKVKCECPCHIFRVVEEAA